MITIIAGSRSFRYHPRAYDLLTEAIIKSGFDITFIRSGGAYGIDSLAVRYAKANGILFDEFPITNEEWRTYRKGAGHMRNLRMADTKPIPQACICVHDGQSTGTIDMFTIMRDRDCKVYLHTVHNPYRLRI